MSIIPTFDWRVGVRRLWGALAVRRERRAVPVGRAEVRDVPPATVSGAVRAAVRAEEAYGRLPAGSREAVDALLAGAPGPEHRAWVRAALAGGADPATLARFAGRIAEVGREDLTTLLDPTSRRVLSQRAGGRRVLQQSTGTTCGSASLVVARMLADPVHALAVLGGFDAVSGATLAGGASPAAIARRFAVQETAVQARTSSSVDRSRARPLPGWKPPWPAALGTPPWGASEEMTNGSGVPGTSYRVHMVDPDSTDGLRRTYADLVLAVDSGRPVLVYTGSDSIPRHVVLATGRTPAGDLEVFNPATGSVGTISEDGFVGGGEEVRRVGSWPRVWATVTPRGARPAPSSVSPNV